AEPATNYSAGCWLFLRVLGLCHLFAFLSLWCQLDGLIGEHGIVPATQWLDAVARQLGPDRFWKVPTLCWLDPSDAFRQTLCAAGSAIALALTIGLAPRLTLCLLWSLYLSLCSVGGAFLGFQWDALLLECTFLAVFIAPRGWRPSLPSSGSAPRRLALLSLWWLLFRLMLLSGAVKLLSKDKLWANLSALSVHFETQPLPTPLAWWAHQLPQPLLTGSCVAMFAIELSFPFLLLCGRPGRRTAGLAFISLMGLIALTGNYCFFNLLVMALSLPLLDNAFFQRMAPIWRLDAPAPQDEQP
ncbi:MAG: lipase maturation factor family protein, partial [Chthoniobacterales bacterium]|nr:lipase maturation factor family protein [Chthoniobacterales bacterium]